MSSKTQEPLQWPRPADESKHDQARRWAVESLARASRAGHKRSKIQELGAEAAKRLGIDPAVFAEDLRRLERDWREEQRERRPVAYYPALVAAIANRSTAVLAHVVKLHDDGTADIDVGAAAVAGAVQRVVFERVPRLAAGDRATPHSWSGDLVVVPCFEDVRAGTASLLASARRARELVVVLRRLLKGRKFAIDGEVEVHLGTLIVASGGAARAWYEDLKRRARHRKHVSHPHEAQLIVDHVATLCALESGEASGHEALDGAVARLALESMTGYPAEFAVELLGHEGAIDLLAKAMPPRNQDPDDDVRERCRGYVDWLLTGYPAKHA